MSEKALALVVRAIDWSETSRIATLWTRELGKVRALAKGGRRLGSNFESALDLLTVCRIVLLRKSSGSLDLLTEAQVVERFPRLRIDLAAFYAGCYIAELLADWTEDDDPHPKIFDEACAALRVLGDPPRATGLRLARFELVLLEELGYRPVFDRCAVCAAGVADNAAAAFSPSVGGMVCAKCRPGRRDSRPLGPNTRRAFQALAESDDAWRRDWPLAVQKELRLLLGEYVTYVRGRRPRLLGYVEKLSLPGHRGTPADSGGGNREPPSGQREDQAR
ncbi:MAG: DNA repair protein RecO [Gemmataceae bacterium]|nr:DNA repair protein RecO [Gemmataceae bacterium]